MRRVFSTSVIVRIVTAGLLVCLASVPGSAQGVSRANVGVSYAFVTDSLSDEALPAGWLVAGAYRIVPRVSIAVEAGGSYRTLDNDAEVRVHAFLAGLRFASDRERRSTPFAQVLVGVGCYCGTTFTFGENSNRFTIQPGAGVDVGLNPRWAVRLQADYRYVAGADDTDGSNQFRASAGLVFRFWE